MSLGFKNDWEHREEAEMKQNAILIRVVEVILKINQRNSVNKILYFYFLSSTFHLCLAKYKLLVASKEEIRILQLLLESYG